MKTNTLRKLNRYKTFFLILIFSIIINRAYSQVYDFGNFYVSDGGRFHVNVGPYNFQTLAGTQTATSRTSTKGLISFDNAITTTGSGSSRFVNGYVRKYGLTTLTYPIGNITTYAPIKLTSTDANGLDAAYYASNPTSSPRNGTVESSLSAVSTTEYWHIIRSADNPASNANAKIYLSWRTSSGVGALSSNSLYDLTIAGWNNNLSTWETIPSLYDTTNIFDSTSSTVTAGSITSTNNVDLGLYQYFTLASKISCQPIVISSGQTKTWNGFTWTTSPTASSVPPTLADPVVLTGNYSGNLSCNSLAINNGITITLANGELLETVNSISGLGKVIMASESSLVQRANAVGTANIELTKKSRLMLWRNYIYFGTPISGNFLGQLNTNSWNEGQTVMSGVSAFDNGSVSGGGPWEYIVGGGGWNAILASTTGKGFIARVNNSTPFSSMNATTTNSVNLRFIGTANNGTISVPVTVSATQYELLANPYPSAIDAQKFIVANPNLNGAIYFWTSATPRSAGATTYTNADYAVWTAAGATNTSPIALKSDGKIASGQGFRIRASTTGTTATFTNCMRLTSGNNSFFKQSTNSLVDRYNMSVIDNNNNGSYNQILMAYLPDATNNYDRIYDAEINSSSPVRLYTLLPDGTKLSINAKESFVTTDTVPLGFSNTTPNQSFTVSVTDKEGVFSTNTVNIYIHDKVNNIYHDMNTPFIFNTNSSQTLNNNFEIVYQSNALNTTDFLSNSIIINIKDNFLTLKSNQIGILNVEIFDITGRKIETYNVNNKLTMTELFLHSDGIYIAKVKLENGTFATHKLINKN